MTHPVIMPALGMAQTAGVIVAWRKQQGDAVRAGDVLMEVETDKATMEVEAAHDGFLVEIRHPAGATVPVGDVIAVIAAEPSGATSAPIANAPAVASAESGSPPPVGVPIIMPALGMAQETGLIVSWRKEPGQRVAADEILLEVETDKATMEVPAGRDGYLAARLAEAGRNVPVGSVIAVISDGPPAAPYRAAAPAAKENAAPAPIAGARSKAGPAPNPGPAPKAVVLSKEGRIFASPKARRLAQERRVDLKLLVAQGIPQPFHASDLDRLVAAPKAASPGAGARYEFKANVPLEPAYAFRDWVAQTTGAAADLGRIWALFAGVSLGRISERSGPIRVGVVNIERTRGFDVPESARLSQLVEGGAGGQPDIVVLDLTGTRVAQAAIDGDAAPVLTLAGGENAGAVSVTLRFDEAQLAAGDALRLLDSFAGRIEDPLRHLL